MNVRDRYFNDIYEKIKDGKDIVIVSSDLGAPSLDKLRLDFPQRFVNVGIAEQNAISVAAGLSLAGKIAITYGLNPFPVTRGFDHIRNIMSSLEIPVTVSGLKVGTCTAEAGFSHMAMETISLLRSLHNVRIITPSDETISKVMVDQIIDKPEPRFIQFDPFVKGTLYDESEIDFDRGFVASGYSQDTAIVTYGVFANEIKKANLETKLIDCFSLPLNKDAFVKAIGECKKIITVEDGIAEGGLGSMVLEILNDCGVSVPLIRKALRFKEGYPKRFTDRNHVFASEGLTLESIKKEILN